MTKREWNGFRDLTFNNWCRNKLPDSKTGLGITDLDFIIYNWKKKEFMIVETKTNMNTVTKNQREIFELLHKLISIGVKSEEFSDWKYKGFNLIQFERKFFHDGRCYLNNKEINESNLIEFLSL